MPRHDTEVERMIHELVPTSRDLYQARETRVPVQLESATGRILATTIQISLEGMKVELGEPTMPEGEVSVYCELPGVRASLEGRAVVERVAGLTWSLSFTHLTPQSALAVRALTRAERVRRSPSTASLTAITLEDIQQAEASKKPTSAMPRPSITLSQMRAISLPAALAADPNHRNTG